MPLPGNTPEEIEARRAYNRAQYAKHREQRLQDKRDQGAERLKQARETNTPFDKMFSEQQQANRRKAANAHRMKRYNGTCERSVHWWKKQIFNRIKQGARTRGIPFDLKWSEMVWPEICPVLGIKLNYGPPSVRGQRGGSPDAPSIDRHDTTLGYVKNNIVVMSWRANMLKGDGDVYEFEKLLSYLRKRAIH